MQPCPNCGAPNRDQARFCARCNSLLRPLPGTGLLVPGAALGRGRFRIVGFLKKGGMGAVYQARDAAGKLWAIKEMSDAAIDPGERPQAIADFKREAELLSTLRHPNLPAALPAFFEDGKWYFALDFIRGRTLEDILNAAPGPLKEETVLGWAAQLCDVLDYLHGQHPPVIFRDVKPANIMVEARTRCLKLIDFGIARFFDPTKSKDTRSMGSLGYAPPEQYGRSTDERSDIYALGAVLYHLLTQDDPAAHPFQFGAIPSLNPAVSTWVEAAIQKALRPDPAHRYQTVAEMRRALAGPSSAPFIHPFHFRSGVVAHTVAEIVRACDRHWEDGTYHLYSGHFAAWLQVVDPTLVSAAEDIVRRAQDQNQGLDEFLRLLAPSLPGPHAVLQPSSLDLGRLTRGQSQTISFAVINRGRGYLQGRVRSAAPWLTVDQNTRDFACPPGRRATVQLTAVGTGQSQTLTTTVVVQSNGGDPPLAVQVQMTNDLFFPQAGVAVGDLAALVQTSAQHRDEAKTLLYSGEIERWLKDAHLRFDLVSRAEEIRQGEPDRDRGLQRFLCAVDPAVRSHLPPIACPDRSRVAFTQVRAGLVSDPTLVAIANVGGGTLTGHVHASEPWLKVRPRRLAGNRETLELWVDTRGLHGARQYPGRVLIQAARGQGSEIEVVLDTAPTPTNFLGIASLVLGLGSWVLNVVGCALSVIYCPICVFAPLLALPAVVLGGAAWYAEKNTPTDRGAISAQVGILAGGLCLLLWLGLIALTISMLFISALASTSS